MSLERVRAKAGTRELELSVLAVPLQLDDGPGALIVLRDDTDSVRLQTRYQRLLETVEGERARYQAQLDERTRELLAANEELTRLERELASALRERAFSRT